MSSLWSRFRALKILIIHDSFFWQLAGNLVCGLVIHGALLSLTPHHNQYIHFIPQGPHSPKVYRGQEITAVFLEHNMGSWGFGGVTGFIN
jgi:hypothetical protein